MTVDPDRARALIEPFEGRTSWMYLDTNGHVTTGIGNLLATPQAAIALIWHHREDGAEANELAIGDEWARVSRAVPGLRAEAYRPLCRLELADHEIERLFRRRVTEFSEQLERAFPLWEEWPEAARLAVLDMAFNLGAHALTNRWPNLCASLRAMDWLGAVTHCHRPQSRDERNEAVKDLFRQAAREHGALPREAMS